VSYSRIKLELNNLSHLKFHYLLSYDGKSFIVIAGTGNEMVLLSPVDADRTLYEVKPLNVDIFDVVKEYSEAGYVPQGNIEFDSLLTELGNELITL